MSVADWIRDDLPDLIWPAFLIAIQGERGGLEFARFQSAVRDIEGVTSSENRRAVSLDGRLTSLDQIPEQFHEQIVDIARDRNATDILIPTELRSVLRLYPNLPGRWLLIEPWSDGNLDANSADGLNLLALTLTGIMADGHKEALLKFLPLSWDVLTANISFPREQIDLLMDYPANKAKWPSADSVIRASFGASKAALSFRHAETVTRQEGWAAVFWQHNWRMTKCVPEEDNHDIADESPPDAPGDSEVSESSGHSTDLVDQLTQAVAAHFNRFLIGAMDPMVPVNLMHPEPHEVISGLVSRTARAVLAVVSAPHQWSGEHASGVLRQFAEVTILMHWLARHGQSGYAEYKSYGLGKSKLMKSRMEEIARQLQELEVEPQPSLTDAIQHIGKRIRDAGGSEFVEVSVESTFSGKSVRQMAIEVDLKELYDQEYNHLSGVTHGEWWAIEDYAMQRCLNPLHRFHWIPSTNPYFPTTPELGHLLVNRLGEVVDLALAQLHQLYGSPDESGDSEASTEPLA